MVNKILEETPSPSPRYLETLADYLLMPIEKEKRRKLMSENRMATIKKRETSFEGLAEKLESGEDGIYPLISKEKCYAFLPKDTITKQDINSIPELAQLCEGIKLFEEALPKAEGKNAYILKKSLIELRKDQYVIKNYFKGLILPSASAHSTFHTRLPSTFKGFSPSGYPIIEGFSFTNWKICSFLLCNYSKLKEETWYDYDDDVWCAMVDFDDLASRALATLPLYSRVVEAKIDGLSNEEIQLILKEEFNEDHSAEYISSLWRNRIPKAIASQAIDDFLDFYYLNVEVGTYKQCGRCGRIKLAHNKYFSRNKTSKDQFYSICKECRNAE